MLNQFIKPVLCSLVVSLTISVVSPSAFAQLPPARSPWLDMFNNPGATSMSDSYLRTVKPQQEMMKAFAAQASQLQTQERALRAMQAPNGGGSGTPPAMNAGALGLSGGAASGGSTERNVLSPPRELPSTQRNPAGFQQYLHYYPAYGLPRKPVPNYSVTGRRR